MTDTIASPDGPDAATALPADIRAFVNEQSVSVPRGGSALDAVRAHAAHLAADVVAGKARITDSRGLPLAPDALIAGGAIMRVLPVREAGAEVAP